MLPLADLPYLVQALPYPLALSCHTPPLFKLCHILWHYPVIPLPGCASPVTASLALPYLFSAMLLVYPGLLRFRPLPCLLLPRSGPILPWLCISPFLHVLLWPVLSSVEQTCPATTGKGNDRSGNDLSFPLPVVALPALGLPWPSSDPSEPALPSLFISDTEK